MSDIVVLVPTLGRAGRMENVARNIRDATEDVPHDIVFVVEEHDQDSCSVAARLASDGLAGWCVNQRKGNYAGAINTAYHVLCDHPEDAARFIFTGADDLKFHPGWATQVLAVMSDTVMVGGTNDLLNPYVLAGHHATHYLIDRRYLENPGGVVDDPENVLPEIYDHNFTDTEFIDTAKARGVFAPCMASVVEHLHVANGKAQWDDTYTKGHAHMRDDEPVFRSREHLWTDHPDGRNLL
jgi:hypothetical protein